MKNKKGFTLVELLVVIAIIGLLSTIAFISLNRARAKARDAKRVSDVRQLQSALELYYNDQSSPAYPRVDNAAVLTSSQLSATYVASIPQAPTPFDEDPAPIECTALTNLYDYHSYSTQAKTANGDGWYAMRFCIGGASGGLAAGCVVAEPSGMANAACALGEP